MKTFQVQYTRTGATVVLLLIIPLFIMTPLLVALAMIGGGHFSEAIVFAAIGVIMAGGIVLTIWMYKRYASVPCEIAMNDEGMKVKLLRPSFLYHIAHYESKWGNIQNVSTNFDPQHNKRFYQVRFKNPGKTITLMPPDPALNANVETEFGTILLSYVDQFNQQTAPVAQILRHGFYDSVWAKVITAITIILSAAIVIIRIVQPGIIPLWRAIAFLAYSVLWLTAYFSNHKKK